MAWIKFEKDLLTDPRVLRIARTLQARWLMFDGPKTPSNEQFDPCNATALPAVTLVLGALVRIWSLSDTHLGSDDLLPLGFDELDEVVGVPGFCALLPSDWIIEVDENTVKLPDFHKHNGTEAKKKAATQKRVEKHRASVNAPALQPRNGPALPDQDQTKTKTIKEKALSAAKPPTDPIPYQVIVDSYHAAMVNLPKVRELTAKRRTMIRTAWQASDARRDSAFWKAYFEECADDAFLNGVGPYLNGHENWRPTFDYLLRGETVTKVYEKAMDRLEREAAA